MFYYSFLQNGNIAFIGHGGDSNRWGNIVSIVDTTTGVLVDQTIYDKTVFSISPDGSQIVIGDSQSTTIVDVNTQNVVENIDGIVLFLPNDNQRLIESKSGWKIVTSENKEICNFEKPPIINLDVYRSVFTITGDTLFFYDDWHQNIEIWDLKQCKLIRQSFMPSGVYSLKYSNDGNYLATNSYSGVHLFNGNNGEYKYSITGNFGSHGTQFFDFSEDSSTIVVVSDDKPYVISFWDLISDKKTSSIPTNFEYIQHVSISPDGKTVATIDYEGIHLWNITNRSLLATISGRFEKIYWNPNSRNFASIKGNSVVFRNSENGDFEKSFSFPNERSEVFFSTDWTYLAIVEDKKVELWDMEGHKLKDLMQYSSLFPTDKSPFIYDLHFSPDTKLLIAVLYENRSFTIRFWDTQTGIILRDVSIPFPISEMAFSPDGKSLTLLGNGVFYVIGIDKQ